MIRKSRESLAIKQKRVTK